MCKRQPTEGPGDSHPAAGRRVGRCDIGRTYGPGNPASAVRRRLEPRRPLVDLRLADAALRPGGRGRPVRRRAPRPGGGRRMRARAVPGGFRGGRGRRLPGGGPVAGPGRRGARRVRAPHRDRRAPPGCRSPTAPPGRRSRCTCCTTCPIRADGLRELRRITATVARRHPHERPSSTWPPTATSCGRPPASATTSPGRGPSSAWTTASSSSRSSARSSSSTSRPA